MQQIGFTELEAKRITRTGFNQNNSLEPDIVIRSDKATRRFFSVQFINAYLKARIQKAEDNLVNAHRKLGPAPETLFSAPQLAPIFGIDGESVRKRHSDGKMIQDAPKRWRADTVWAYLQNKIEKELIRFDNFQNIVNQIEMENQK
jgi:hypothetical protein